MNIPDIDLPRVVVIGAGFAGLKLARQINTNFYQLVLIDRNNYHTFQPLLYQVASAGLEPDSIAYPVRKTLRRKRNTYFRLTSVSSIDRRGRDSIVLLLRPLSPEILCALNNSRKSGLNGRSK